MEQVAGITEEMSKLMKTAVNVASNNTTTDIRQQVEELKRQKTRKSAFTKARKAMLILLEEDLPSRREISQQQKVEDCQEEVMIVMEALMDKYLAEGD